jgi:glycosyltransferase involved in cell wall biosynthesis
VKPRVLFVSRRVELPLAPSLERKWDAIGRELDFRVLAGGNRASVDGGTSRFPQTPSTGPLRGRALRAGAFHLARELPVLDGPAFFAALPARIARELRAFRPHAVLAQGAHETAAALAARRLARVDTSVIADLHGDWRAPTRLYGSRLRSALNPVADRVALSALRNADGIRTVTGYTTSLVRALGLEPADEFPAYMDFDSFLQELPQPLPAQPQVLFVGVLERYKNVDGLADAWRRAAPRVPEARLRLVGSGTLRPVVEDLLRELPRQTTWNERLSQREISHALDESTALVLPSRSEGMGRVIVEAFCRARPVVASRVGGIPDLVEDDVNGLLVEPGDTKALADALVRVLTDRELAERLGAQAQASSGLWTISPEEFATRLRSLVERITGLS